MVNPSTADEIRLTIPARPAYVRLARLTGAAVAGRLGFSYDDVEDLRIAVDELCSLLVGVDGRDGSMTLRFATDETDGQPASIVVTGEGPAGQGPAGHDDVSEFSRQILAALVDSYEVERSDGLIRFSMQRGLR